MSPTHTGYKCNLCEYTFKTKFALDYHTARMDHSNSTNMVRVPGSRLRSTALRADTDPECIVFKNSPDESDSSVPMSQATTGTIQRGTSEQIPRALQWIPKTQREVLLKGLRDE